MTIQNDSQKSLTSIKPPPHKPDSNDNDTLESEVEKLNGEIISEGETTYLRKNY